jgi:hypothetical protein
VNAVAFNTASRGELSDSVSILQSKISELELAVNEKSSQIDKEMAVNLGLTQKTENDKIFVLKNQNTRLTLNE